MTPPEPPWNETERAERLHRLTEGLLRGRRVRAGPGDAPDRDAIQVAALLVGVRHRHRRPTPRFRRRLRALLTGDLPAVAAAGRRRALVNGAAAAAGIVGGAGAAAVARSLVAGAPARTASAPAVIDPAAGRWADVAVPAYVFRRGHSVWAVSAICSHLPCELGWDRRRELLVCPCHGRGFDASGQPRPGDGPLPPLARVRIRVVAGRVQVLGTR